MIKFFVDALYQVKHEGLNVFPLVSGTRQGCLLLSLLLTLNVLLKAIWQAKEIAGIQFGKEK